VEPKQTDCRLQKRIVWVIPVQEIPVTGLQSAFVHRERVTGTDENGEPTDHDVYDVILVSDSGEINLADADQRWALLSHSTADRINDYLDTPTDEPLTIWGYGLWIHTLSTLCSGSFFLVFAFVFVTSMVQSILLFGAWTTEFVLFAVGRGMDSAGLFPKARDHIPRLRQAVRGIAIQSHDNDSAQTDHQAGN
jgi:hypothetical protein